jgi:hypothetical protein
MATCRELYDKYSTGVRHTSPAAVEYPDGAFRSHYICRGSFGKILREYIDHLSNPPTDRCRQISSSDDGVIRSDMDLTDEELGWAFVEDILRRSLDKFLGIDNYYTTDKFVEFIVTVKEN